MIDLPVLDPADPPAGTHLRPSATGGARVAALDGLRAIALLLIVGFHFGVGWMPAGFVGVDVFYVLSGYLITGLLLGEWARSARIRLGAFWARRARRLLPALAVVLVVVTLVVRLTYPAGLYPDLRMADLSALFYFSNWWQIAASGNYFVATGAVSPLTHTWSLAVEEQFYLVWPLVVVAVLHLGRRFDRGVELLLGISLVGVVASATEMAWLYHPGANITRLYFGTDTHAQSILVGSVLACVLTLVQRRRGLAGMAPMASSRPARVALTGLGLAGLAGTLVLTATLSGTSPIAYRGGFLVSALSAAALITGSVCVAGGPIARVLSVRPMVWIGTVSYGAYLWHFPVFIELDTARTGLGGAGLLAVRVAATFVLAGLSYYLVERPVMEGVFWRSLRAAAPALAALAATVAVVVVGTVAPATAAARTVAAPRAALPAAVHDRLRVGRRLHDRPRPVPDAGRLGGHHPVGRPGRRQRPRLRRAGRRPGRVRLRLRRRPRLQPGPARHALHHVPPVAHPLRRRHRPDPARRGRAAHSAGGRSPTGWSTAGRSTSANRPGTPTWWPSTPMSSGAWPPRRSRSCCSPSRTSPRPRPHPTVPRSPRTGPSGWWRSTATWHGWPRPPGARSRSSTSTPCCRPTAGSRPWWTGSSARWPDGIHVTPAGGQWLQPRILPTVAVPRPRGTRRRDPVSAGAHSTAPRPPTRRCARRPPAGSASSRSTDCAPSPC